MLIQYEILLTVYYNDDVLKDSVTPKMTRKLVFIGIGTIRICQVVINCHVYAGPETIHYKI